MGVALPIGDLSGDDGVGGRGAIDRWGAGLFSDRRIAKVSVRGDFPNRLLNHPHPCVQLVVTGQYATAPQAEQQAWTDFCQMLLATNAFLYVE